MAYCKISVIDLFDLVVKLVKLLPTAEQNRLTYRVFFPEGGAKQLFSSQTVTIEEICYVSIGMVVHADEKVAPGAFEMSDLVSDKIDTEILQ